MGRSVELKPSLAYTESKNSAETESVRFSFGENWSKYVRLVDEARINRAVESLQTLLGVKDLRGKRFLDIGSGSGLFSLAARKLGATVVSFDYDPIAVQCAMALRQRYFPQDSAWEITQGSILDHEFVEKLGRHDFVYSWGVLHHTGEMWKAIAQATTLVDGSGTISIAIYNDQGRTSKTWKAIKRFYNRSGSLGQKLLLAVCFMRLWGPTFLRDSLRGRPLHSWRTYRNDRGMSPWRDVVDWVGGYPFEVAKPEEVFDFFRQRGFQLKYLKTCAGGIGCNEFVFQMG